MVRSLLCVARSLGGLFVRLHLDLGTLALLQHLFVLGHSHKLILTPWQSLCAGDVTYALSVSMALNL